MRSLIEAARRNDVHAMMGGIDATNAGSIALHERLGFKHVGTRCRRWASSSAAGWTWPSPAAAGHAGESGGRLSRDATGHAHCTAARCAVHAHGGARVGGLRLRHRIDLVDRTRATCRTRPFSRWRCWACCWPGPRAGAGVWRRWPCCRSCWFRSWICVHRGEASGRAPLRLMSFNVKAYEGRQQADGFGRLAWEIALHDADVIAMQDANFANTAESLPDPIKAALGSGSCTCPASTSSRAASRCATAARATSPSPARATTT